MNVQTITAQSRKPLAMSDAEWQAFISDRQGAVVSAALEPALCMEVHISCAMAMQASMSCSTGDLCMPLAHTAPGSVQRRA